MHTELRGDFTLLPLSTNPHAEPRLSAESAPYPHPKLPEIWGNRPISAVEGHLTSSTRSGSLYKPRQGLFYQSEGGKGVDTGLKKGYYGYN